MLDPFGGRLALGDVLADRDEVLNPSVSVGHRRDGHCRVELAAVLASADQLAGPYPPAKNGLPHALVEAPVLVPRIEYLTRIATDDFARRKTGKSGKRRIGPLDRCAHIGNHDTAGNGAQCRLEETQARFQLLANQRVPYRPSQGILLEQLPLDQIVLRTCLQRLLGKLMVVLTGKHDDRHVGRRKAHPLHGCEARRIGQRQIEQDDIRLAGADRGDASGQGRRPDDRILFSQLSQAGKAHVGPDQPHIAGIVFDHENRDPPSNRLVHPLFSVLPMLTRPGRR